MHNKPGNFMRHYTLYIAKHLMHITVLIALSLTSIVWLTQALRLIDFIVNQGVSVGIFLELTLLLIPSLLFMILPLAMFCATVFFYHKLKMDSELVALQAAGLNKWQLAKPALIVATAATFFGIIISAYLLPLTYGKFRDMQLFLRNNYVSILLQEGVFATPVSGLTVFIRERDEDGTLHGILVHDNRQPNISVTMMAEDGRMVETPAGPRFLLSNGNRQEIFQGKLSLLNFDRYTLDISLYMNPIGNRNLDTQEQSIPDLFAATGKEGPEAQKMRAEGHQRLLWPFYTLSLTFLALAVVLSGEHNRRLRWQRNILATVLATFLIVAAVGLRNVIASNPIFVPITYLTVLMPMLLASWSLSSVQGFSGFSAVRNERQAA